MGGGEGKPPHPRTVLGRLKTWLTPGYDEISFSPPRSLRRKLQLSDINLQSKLKHNNK